MQEYDPTVFPQLPAPQTEPVAHSSTSTHVALSPVPERTKPGEQVQV